jgi:hypothetical protein
MISTTLRELIESARALLPEQEEWQMMNSMPKREPKRADHRRHQRTTGNC